jgi:carboxylate-amine ligase
MNKIGSFRGNSWPTLGVEIELQLVDAETMELRSAIHEILADVPAELRSSIKPEFMQCYVEVNTEICRTAAEAESDLAAKIRCVDSVARSRGLRLFWSGTHPFSRWRDQQITPDDRYFALADLLQETVIRPVTFGLHVHVGVPSGDVAIATIARLETYLPLLLALSANSPFWHGRFTGHHAHRVEILEGLPTGGLPPRMRGWDDYLRLVDQMRTAGFIDSERELWWDARPNAENGTIEVRICDMPPDLPTLAAECALIQCLVHELAYATDDELSEPPCGSVMIRQNRWRACRYGMDAELVDPSTLHAVSARDALKTLVSRLQPMAAKLGCAGYLDSMRGRIAQPTGSERQIALFQQTGDLRESVRAFVDIASASTLKGAHCTRGEPVAPARADVVSPLTDFAPQGVTVP